MNNVDEILKNARKRQETRQETQEANSQQPTAKSVFPIEVFPECLQGLINTLDEVCNYPKDYTAGGLILSFATAVGNTKRIKVKEGITDYLCFYIVAVGDAGANKSKPFKSILKTIKDKDYQEYLTYKKQITESEKAEGEQRPKQLNFILQDFTPEMIAKSLEANERGLLIFNDELLSWLKSFNRYNKGGGENMYLSLWSGESIKVNRASGECISVKNPLLNIGGTLQPSRLNEAFTDNGSGFIDRFLFVYPAHPKPNEWNDLHLDKNIFQKYNEVINRAFQYSEFTQEGKPKYIECTTEARAEIIKYINDNIKTFAGLDDWEKSLFGKLHSYFLRFCLLLYCMDKYTLEDDHQDTITPNIVERAKKLFEYFTATAYKVRERLHNGTDYISTLNQTKQNLYNALNENFTTSEAVELGVGFGMNERAIYRMLKDKRLFKKMKIGKYRKLS